MSFVGGSLTWSGTHGCNAAAPGVLRRPPLSNRYLATRTPGSGTPWCSARLPGVWTRRPTGRYARRPRVGAGTGDLRPWPHLGPWRMLKVHASTEPRPRLGAREDVGAMRLHVEDGIATVLVAVVIVPYVGYLLRGSVPLVQDPRGMAAVGLVLGIGLAYTSWRSLGSAHRTAGLVLAGTSPALGVAALLLAETFVAEVMLAVFMVSIVALWGTRFVDRRSEVLADRGAPSPGASSFSTRRSGTSPGRARGRSRGRPPRRRAGARSARTSVTGCG